NTSTLGLILRSLVHFDAEFEATPAMEDAIREGTPVAKGGADLFRGGGARSIRSMDCAVVYPESPPRRSILSRFTSHDSRSSQLAELDATVGASIERKILWLAENASGMVHRRLVGMPEDLAGLCKLRIGDWRILYWV